MNRFAELLDRLVLTPSRNGKLTLLVDYFRAVEDPDRGLALAAITGDLAIAAVKPAMLRALVAERMDPVLFGYSYDYVGDLAETVSLVWPEPSRPHARNHALTLGDVVEQAAVGQPLRRADGAGAACSTAPASPARFAIIKLVTGGLRIGVSARLAKQALADFGKVDVAEIEELWHGLAPPYDGAVRLAGGQGAKAREGGRGAVPAGHAVQPGRGQRPRKARPGRLCRRMEMGRHPRPGGVARAACAGSIRAPATTFRGAFPDLVEAMDFDAALDGELLVGRPPECDRHLLRPAAAAEPQDRVAEDARAISGLHALLRPPAAGRRGPARPALHRAARAARSASSARSTRRASTCRRSSPSPTGRRSTRCACTPPHPVIEGVMLKRLRFALSRRAAEGPVVQVEARSAHGRRGADVCAARPRQALELLFRLHVRRLVGPPKARRSWCRSARPISASPTRSCRQIDKYVRDNTIERFGPVRSVRADRGHGLVLEVAFEGLNRSTAAQIGRRHALSRASRGCAGTSRPPRPTASRRCRRCSTNSPGNIQPISILACQKCLNE